MKYFMATIEEMYSFFVKMEKQYENELKGCPIGRLNYYRRGKHLEHFQSYRCGNSYIKHGITKNPEMIRKLARKHYVTAALNIVQENLKGLKYLISRYKDLDYDTVSSNLPKACRFLEPEYFLAVSRDKIESSRNNYMNWGDASYEQSDYLAENRTKITSWGLRVRSKSELLIAEFLRARGVPFRYEQILRLEGREFAPDFTLLRKDGKVIYWEHLGLPDDEDYMKAFYKKLDVYIRNGIVPGDNLIITFDGSEGNIDMNLIESTVKSYMEQTER